MLLFAGGFLSAQEAAKIKWYTANEAFELQKKAPKKILIDVYTDWCGWCKRMDESTFKNPKVVEYLNKNYYCVKFNAEGNETVNLNDQVFVKDGQYGKTHSFTVALGISGYPSIAYFNEQSQFLTTVPGYQTPENILPILTWFGSDTYKVKDYQTFSEEYNKKN